MARKEKTVVVSFEGRDRGKTFVLQEMSADQGERWAIRTLLALSRGGIEVPNGMFEGGFHGLATMAPYLLIIGLKSLHSAQWAEFEPLLDEMMMCVKFKPPMAGIPLQELFAGENCQIEEIATRLWLRRQVLELHMGFSLAAVSSTTESPPIPPDQTSA